MGSTDRWFDDFAVGDRIDLSAIDPGGNNVFVFGTGAFTGHPGEVRVVSYGGGLSAGPPCTPIKSVRLSDKLSFWPEGRSC